MFRSLAAKIAIVHLCYLALFSLLVSTTVIAIGAQGEKQLVLSLTERQSMLSQRITQQLLGYAAKLKGGENLKFQRDAAVGSMQMFEKTQRALGEGGLVRLDLRLLNLGEIPPGSLALQEQQRRVGEVYNPFREYARRVLDGGTDQRRGAVEYIINHNSQLLRELDACATIVKVDLKRHISLVRSIQTTALGLGILLTIALLFFSRIWLVLPLSELSRASKAMSLGDISHPIAVEGPTEFRELASTFERLRVALKNFLATPESDSSL